MTEQIDTSTTAEKIAVMQAHDNGDRVEIRVRGRELWRPVSACEVPAWDWPNFEYRIAPDPDAEWREEMMQAWRDGELEVRNYGEWQSWLEYATFEPALDRPKEDYRRRPAPTTRPWNCPEDVPAVCWLRRETYAPGACYLVIGMNRHGVVFQMGRSKYSEQVGYGELSCYEYSTDRRTWLPCCIEVQK